MSNHLNETFEIIKEHEDYFEAIYANPWLNWSMLGCYAFGLISCLGLRFASWFERSGQAGHFRTLVNQLASTNMDQIILMYSISIGIQSLRYIVGPLPYALCRMSTIVKTYGSISISLHTLAIAVTKFSFIFIFKSIPVMDDNLLSTLIFLNVQMIALLSVCVKYYVEERSNLMEAVCSGLWNDQDSGKTSFKLATYIIFGCVILYILLTTLITVKKCVKTPTNQPLPPHNAQNSTDLGSSLLSFSCKILLSANFIIFAIFERIDPDDLKTYPYSLFPHVMNSILPTTLITIYCAIIFLAKKEIRRAALMFFFPNQIHPIVA